MLKNWLAKNPSNKAWIENEEQHMQKKREDANRLSLIRKEMFPELMLAQVELAVPNEKRSAIAQEIVDHKMNRMRFNDCMKELLLLKIDPEVLDEVDENNTNLKQRKTNAKYNTRPWAVKSQAIFFYFHPEMGRQDINITCQVWNLNALTFKNWISQKQYYPKWVSYVQKYEASHVKENIPLVHCEKFKAVDDASKVIIPSKFMHSDGKVYLVPTKSRAGHENNDHEESRQKKRKIASKSKTVIYIPEYARSVGATGKKVAWPIQETFIITKITESWETGNPITRASCYAMLIREFGNEKEEERNEFEKSMKFHDGGIAPAFSQWFSRVLERHRFSVRKESISQTVPKNWNELAIACAKQICEVMKSAGVTKLINADEMFLNFYPKETQLIAPTGVKRVGANRKENHMEGCTVMVSAEMMTSQLLAPFVIMTAQVEGNLSRQYADWEGSSAVNFNPTHWMTSQMAKRYLKWLTDCFPDEKIGLIWDSASTHVCEDVVNCAEELGLIMGFIPAGLTSVLQVCDMVVNKPLKQRFKQQYCAYKTNTDPGPGGKYKLHRDTILTWLERSFENFNRANEDNKTIQKAFKRYGQDPRVEDFEKNEEFVKHLAKLCENSIYNSLITQQEALSLCE